MKYSFILILFLLSCTKSNKAVIDNYTINKISDTTININVENIEGLKINLNKNENIFCYAPSTLNPYIILDSLIVGNHITINTFVFNQTILNFSGYNIIYLNSILISKDEWIEININCINYNTVSLEIQ